MGESRRTKKNRLSTLQTSKRLEESPRILDWFPLTKKQQNQFIKLTIRGSWVGIGLLVAFWLVVRIIGPAMGWWVPADLK